MPLSADAFLKNRLKKEYKWKNSDWILHFSRWLWGLFSVTWKIHLKKEEEKQRKGDNQADGICLRNSRNNSVEYRGNVTSRHILSHPFAKESKLSTIHCDALPHAANSLSYPPPLTPASSCSYTITSIIVNLLHFNATLPPGSSKKHVLSAPFQIFTTTLWGTLV